ncbi:hypothetical protein J2T56_002026 [Natronobacillus azotifigens]|uniref:Uncharacterized protein n=1 Tax=Natronobacillus azotifigens TaxID=472978 RepID=A0A9J6RE72_9BACI|nr:hypothetical protein [Natronobacillus azotifigens]MCZ0703765.1 hypothetical protein [Natronobacillus azotifigens]
MKKKVLMTLGTFAVSVGLLAGCNGEVEDPVETPPTEDPVEDPAGETENDSL